MNSLFLSFSLIFSLKIVFGPLLGGWVLVGVVLFVVGGQSKTGRVRKRGEISYISFSVG